MEDTVDSARRGSILQASCLKEAPPKAAAFDKDALKKLAEQAGLLAIVAKRPAVRVMQSNLDAGLYLPSLTFMPTHQDGRFACH